MSLFIFFAVVLAIIGFQIFAAQREYARKQQQEENKLNKTSVPSQTISKLEKGHYAITPGESLAPQLKPKHFKQTKPVNQS
ncbi:hypothetical protein EXU85_05550 [Spirosoma sp. KCTC 42546]|uniref:hypothetical protein n=1 Tax=Spirosoma sp. KCTC 42546 TaxID=2520506 RepID=UPI001156F981|nr:hypothetical protein [Spirosoma sp. KCTC 42546]QDK78086.1 hypothetical protein EXU85_05550 [Spirosoma sp. KCTC 42546]